MEFEFLSINFYEIFITIISVLILGFVSICLFFWFKGSNIKTNDYLSNSQSSITKKKNKKKANLTKSSKVNNDSEEPIFEKTSKSKHIEIKNCAEILKDSTPEKQVNLFLLPSKPILRKNDDPILLNEEICQENVWSKIPKDEVEIHRSRQSSMISESRSVIKEELEIPATKLSRGQKKRLKAKLRVIELKLGDSKHETQLNTNALYDEPNEDGYTYMSEARDLSNRSSISKNVNKITNKNLQNCCTNSTGSSVNNDKLHSFSSVEIEDKIQIDSSIEDFKEIPDFLKEENFEVQKYVNSMNNDSETLAKCNRFELENKNLKQEIGTLKLKINELSAISSTVVDTKSENEILLKKQAELDRNFSSIQKELTINIQKTAAAESRILRLNNERNQQISYFENEMNKSSNKISMLEADIRAKNSENENLKMTLEQIRHVVSDRDQLLQNQKSEFASLEDRYLKKLHEYQEIDVALNNVTKKMKEFENENRELLEENQKIKRQIDLQAKEKEKEFERYKIEIKNKEREQNSLITSLQYQIDEFRTEKQMSMFDPEIENLKEENEKLKSLYEKSKDRSFDENSIPDGYELIDSETLKILTTQMNEANLRLREKCDEYTFLTVRQMEKEKSLVEKHSKLELNYNKLNSDLEVHLNEIVNLRKCIEALQSELSKNSENNFEEIKSELEEKCEKLRKTEEILVQLESSVHEEECKWKEMLNLKNSETEQLENELTQKALIIKNQYQKINELSSLLNSNNQFQSESVLNGSLSVE